MYIYAMHDFNRLMSAMSIDGIWQNNLITLFLRLDRMQLLVASLAYVSVSMLANCIFPHSSPYTHWPATVGSFPVHVLELEMYS